MLSPLAGLSDRDVMFPATVAFLTAVSSLFRLPLRRFVRPPVQSFSIGCLVATITQAYVLPLRPLSGHSRCSDRSIVVFGVLCCLLARTDRQSVRLLSGYRFIPDVVPAIRFLRYRCSARLAIWPLIYLWPAGLFSVMSIRSVSGVSSHVF